MVYAGWFENFFVEDKEDGSGQPYAANPWATQETFSSNWDLQGLGTINFISFNHHDYSRNEPPDSTISIG